MKRPIWWVAGALIVVTVGALVYSWWSNRRTPTVTPATQEATAAPTPPVQNPVPVQSQDAPPLPALSASDATAHDGLAQLFGQSVDNWINPENVIRHIVVTVDNLPRRRVAVELRPVKPVPGAFRVDGNDQHATESTDNYSRYAPYVDALDKLDVKAVTTLYFRLYPLFQQAYQDLGYPNGYFNDRLVEAIDDALATPEPTVSADLVRPNVMYQYADARLESASAGQKLLLRVGPENAARVKKKLSELRIELASRTRVDDDTRQRNP